MCGVSSVVLCPHLDAHVAASGRTAGPPLRIYTAQVDKQETKLRDEKEVNGLCVVTHVFFSKYNET